MVWDKGPQVVTFWRLVHSYHAYEDERTPTLVIIYYIEEKDTQNDHLWQVANLPLRVDQCNLFHLCSVLITNFFKNK